MKRIYKYISFLALTLLLGTTACRKVEIDPDIDGKYEIAFDQVTTKAVITDQTLESFKVWGETVAGAADVFNGVEVKGSEKDAENKYTKWSYYTDEADAKYWEENKTYDFFAIAPLGLGTGVVYDPEKGWGVNFNVVESMDADDQVDFILAQAQRTSGNITSPPDPVELGFTHKLSKVKLKLKKDNGNANQTITLKEIEQVYGSDLVR